MRVPTPGPAFVRLKLPPIAPPIVGVLVVPLTATCTFVVSVPGPFKFNALVPEPDAIVKFPAHVCAFVVVTAPPLVLVTVPALTVNVPVPSALLLLMLSVPAESVVPPLYEFAPESVRAPAPLLVTAKAPPLSEITELTIIVPTASKFPL